jgi:hypothetical protein
VGQWRDWCRCVGEGAFAKRSQFWTAGSGKLPNELGCLLRDFTEQSHSEACVDVLPNELNAIYLLCGAFAKQSQSGAGLRFEKTNPIRGGSVFASDTVGRLVAYFGRPVGKAEGVVGVSYSIHTEK